MEGLDRLVRLLLSSSLVILLYTVYAGTLCYYTIYSHFLMSIFWNSILPFPQVNLVTLDLADNKIKRVQNVSHLFKLEEFWVIIANHNPVSNPPVLMQTHIRPSPLLNPPSLPLPPQFNDNQLDHWADIDQLRPATGLKTVYFQANPIAKDPQYRRKLKLAVPSLTQIDATMAPRT